MKAIILAAKRSTERPFPQSDSKIVVSITATALDVKTKKNEKMNRNPLSFDARKKKVTVGNSRVNAERILYSSLPIIIKTKMFTIHMGIINAAVNIE